MTQIRNTAVLALLALVIFAVSFSQAKAAEKPTAIEGYSLGMSVKDAESLSVKNGLSEFNRAAIDSEYSQIVYEGKIAGFSQAKIFLVVAKDKVVGVTLEATAANDAEKKTIKAKQDALLKEWKAIFGSDPEDSYGKLMWTSEDIEYSLYPSDGEFLTVVLRLK